MVDTVLHQGLKDQLKGVESSNLDLKKDNVDLKDKLVDLKEKNLELTESNKNLTNEVKGLQGNVSDLQGTVKDLQGNVDTANSNINSLKNEVEGLQSNVDSLKDEVNDLQGNVESLRYDSMQQYIELTQKIQELTDAVKASRARAGGGSNGGGGGRSSSTSNDILSRNNAVAYGNNIVGQGGHVVINGNKSNVTFVLTAPTSGVISSANALAGRVGGTLVNCVMTSSPGVAFSSARCNFYCSGVVENDNIAVYLQRNNTWTQLSVPEIRRDHVVVDMPGHGAVAFIRVPALASVSN